MNSSATNPLFAETSSSTFSNAFAATSPAFGRFRPYVDPISPISPPYGLRSMAMQKTSAVKSAITDQQVFSAVCRSLLIESTTNPNRSEGPLPAPLSLEHRQQQDHLCINWDRWTVEGISARDDNDFDAAWRLNQFEAALRIASRVRSKIRRISAFLYQMMSRSTDHSLFSKLSTIPSQDFASKYLLTPDEMVTPVCAGLTAFSTEFNTLLMEKLNPGNAFTDLFQFGAFVRSLEDRLASLPAFFDQLISSTESDVRKRKKSDENPPICTFWHCFLQNLSGGFHWPEAPNPILKSHLFASIARLLGNYLTRRLMTRHSVDPSTTDQFSIGKLQFFEALWLEEPEMLQMLHFSTKFAQFAPMKELEENGLLCAFYQTFMAQWREFEDQGRLRHTQCFLIQLTRQALRIHCMALDRVVISHLIEGNLLANQLAIIREMCSLNPGSKAELMEEKAAYNQQSWPLRILLDCELYDTLYSLLAHLRRLQHTNIRVIDAVASGKPHPRRRWASGAAPFAIDDIKERIRRTLSIQLARQFQTLLQIQYSHFSTLNSIYARNLLALLVQRENKMCLNELQTVVCEWKSALSATLNFSDELLHEPIEEILQIGDAFCNPIQNINEDEDDGDEDPEVRYLDELLVRLRRACLFIRNREPLQEQQHQLDQNSASLWPMNRRSGGESGREQMTSSIGLLRMLQMMTLPYAPC